MWLRGAASLTVVALVVRFLLLPALPAARHALAALAGVDPALLLVGVVLEAASLATYSVLTRAVLPDETRPAYGWLLRTDLTALGASHVTLAGAATSNVVRVGLLHRGGVSSEDAVAGIAIQGGGSAIVLQAILGAAALLGVAVRAVPPAYLATVALVVVVLAAELTAVRAVGNHPDGFARVVGHVARWSPRRWRERVRSWVSPASARVVRLLSDRRLVRGFVTWGTLNWCLDVAALWVFLAAFGVHPHPLAVLVAYGVANVLAGLPVSPGGLGLVEAAAVSVLVALGEPSAPVVLGVVAWRVVQFWLPIPVGAACYASLLASRRGAGGPGRVAVSRARGVHLAR